MGERPAPRPVGQFSASVPAKAERTNTWQWAGHTASDVSFPPSACFLSELLPPFPRGCWEVGARDVALFSPGAAVFLLKRGVGRQDLRSTGVT